MHHDLHGLALHEGYNLRHTGTLAHLHSAHFDKGQYVAGDDLQDSVM